MKKTLLSAALVAGLTIFVPQIASAAADGTITISGKVLSATCTVSVNGGSTVVMPAVMATDLAGKGTVAGGTPFTVGLTGCDKNSTSATMKFSGGNIDSASGNLNNTVATGGSDVQIQLMTGGNKIDTRTSGIAPVITLTAPTSSTVSSGSVAMVAKYVAVNAVTTPGLVTSTVDFTLTYL